MHSLAVAKREPFQHPRNGIHKPEARDAFPGMDRPLLVLIDPPSRGRYTSQVKSGAIAREVASGHSGTVSLSQPARSGTTMSSLSRSSGSKTIHGLPGSPHRDQNGATSSPLKVERAHARRMADLSWE